MPREGRELRHNLGVRLDDELADQLREIARALGITESAAARGLLRIGARAVDASAQGHEVGVSLDLGELRAGDLTTLGRDVENDADAPES